MSQKPKNDLILLIIFWIIRVLTYVLDVNGFFFKSYIQTLKHWLVVIANTKKEIDKLGGVLGSYTHSLTEDHRKHN